LNVTHFKTHIILYIYYYSSSPSEEVRGHWALRALSPWSNGWIIIIVLYTNCLFCYWRSHDGELSLVLVHLAFLHPRNGIDYLTHYRRPREWIRGKCSVVDTGTIAGSRLPNTKPNC